MLLKTKIKKLMDLKNKNSRWLFWHQNKFFDETPITGFSFIAAATNRLEIGFWWFLIISFLSITAVNVSNAVSTYHDQPMNVIVNPSAERQTQIPNMSITLHSPLWEFTQRMPFPFNVNGIRKNQHSLNLYSFFCNINIFGIHFDEVEHMIEQFLNSAKDWKMEKLKHETYSPTNDWHPKLQGTAAKLKEFLLRIETQEIKGKGQADAWQEFETIIDEPLQREQKDLMYLLLLDSFQTGQNPIEKLSISKYNLWTVSDLLNGSRIIDVYTRAANFLSSVLQLELVDVPDGRTILKEWSYGRGKTKYSKQNHQTVTFQVVIPPNVSHLHIKGWSLVKLWYQYIMETFGTFLRKYNTIETYRCGGESFWDIMQFNIVEMMREEYFAAAITGELQTDTGNIATFTPTISTEYSLETTISLASEIRNCSKTSLEECTTGCLVKAAISKCHCMPWTFLYKEQSVEICTEPCDMEDEREACSIECDKLLEHPCQKTLTRLTRTLDLYTIWKNDLQEATLFDLKINVPKSRGLAYVQTYDLTIDGLVANVGGLLDLWCGINLFSFIHLIIYLLKKCNQHHRNPVRPIQTSELQNLEHKLSNRMVQIRKKIEVRIRRLSHRLALQNQRVRQI